MPRADVKPLETGPGFGCSCPSFKFGQPTPEQALAALARSASVAVFGKKGEDHEFIAWTNPEVRHVVIFDPDKPGGHCKHITACLTHWAPWHRQLALGADDALSEIKRLKGELKKRSEERR